MKTTFDVGDTVLIPAMVTRIFITDKGTFYRVKVRDDDGGCAATIDKKEESIGGVVFGTSAMHSEETGG